MDSLSQTSLLQTVICETAAENGEEEVVMQLGTLRLLPSVLVADIEDEDIEDEDILDLILIRRYSLVSDSQLTTLRFECEEFVLSRGTEDQDGKSYQDAKLHSEVNLQQVRKQSRELR